ncbi:hypothetical protein ES703_55917 [subsurface metagenome]
MQILKRLMCWGCGSVKEEYIESTLEVPVIEEWNICKECLEKEKK